jgi:hypothetical protein
MPDTANPAPPSPPASPPPDSPPASPTSSTTTPTVTAPDGSPSTVLTEAAHAPDPAAAAEPPKTETPEETTPFDVSKLTFPEELGKPDEGVLNEFGEVAKSLNLTQDGAQKLADLHTKVLQSASEANTQAWKTTIEGWQNEIKADPEIGGDKLKVHQTNFARVLADPRFHVDGVLEALDLTGAGSNPAINRFIAKVVSALTEGGIVQGEPGQARQPRSAAQAMYPGLKSEAGD